MVAECVVVAALLLDGCGREAAMAAAFASRTTSCDFAAAPERELKVVDRTFLGEGVLRERVFAGDGVVRICAVDGVGWAWTLGDDGDR